ncbi:MAG: Fic family protein [Sphingomonadales bacterium]|jgi:Fic family protein
MTQKDRSTQAFEPELITDPKKKAEKEAMNAVKQFDCVLDLIDQVARDGRSFKLRPSTILQLHQIAMEGLSRYAGNWRPDKAVITGSQHKPPERVQVPGLIEDMCDWINDNWQKRSAVQLCAYVMWRLNWIHPFDDGNGRTSRAIAYLVLCCRLGDRLPGENTVPEQITHDKKPYYDALEQADLASTDIAPDTSALETLLAHYIANQLVTALDNATNHDMNDSNDRRFH